MIENQSISKKERIGYQPGRDLLSDLPLSIIHGILALVPIREAIRTSCLSRQWRYTWTSLLKERLKNIITHVLFRHKGPIQTFQLSHSFQRSCLNVKEWVLCLARNDIRELILDMSYDHSCWAEMHSSVYSCDKLTYLELSNCIMDPPPSNFKGCLFLKCLTLIRVSLSPDEIEILVANSPLLERFELADYRNPKLRISAPNLKYLDLTGKYIEMFLYTPLLAEMSVELYGDDFTTKPLHQKASVCNYTNFFGGFTNLEKLSGDIFFTKFLSIGIESCHHSLVLRHLKDIQLDEVSFEHKKEILVIARLITDTPNLHNLQITVSDEG